MNPPSVGPSVGPTMMPTPNIACPIATSFGTSASSEREAPQKNDATTNSPIENVRYRRRPKYADSQPDIGITMTFATMYPVETHEISSSVAPRFPIMWGIATFTIDVSMSSSIAAIVTAMPMRYLYRYLSADGSAAGVIMPCLLRRDVRGHRHARTQRPVGTTPLRHLDAHGNALHDLREVARRVVGRQERELREG